MDWLAVLAADSKRTEAKKRELEQLIQRREEEIEDLIHKEAEHKEILSKIAVTISRAEEIIDNSSIALKAAEREIEHIKELQGYENRMNFLAFPQEIQQMIFTFLLTENEPIALSLDKRFAWQKSLAVFRVCRTMQHMAQETFYELNSFKVLEDYSDNASTLKERLYSPPEKYLQHLEVEIGRSTKMFDLLKIIEDCNDLITLTLVFSHYPDFREWPKFHPPEFKLPPKVKTVNLVLAQTLRRGVVKHIFTKLKRALGEYCTFKLSARKADVVKI